MLSVVADEAARSELAMSLDELAREGARRMLAVALEAEVDAYITGFAELTDTTAIGWYAATATLRPADRHGRRPDRGTRPRVDDRRVDRATGTRRQFHSVILPAGSGAARRSPRCCRCCTCMGCPARLRPGVDELLGSAAGLSASVITRLYPVAGRTGGLPQRDLGEVDYVYCWADGVVRHEAPCDRVG